MTMGVKDLFPRSLELDLDEHTFRDVEASELERALRPRTEVGLVKAAQIRRLGPARLADEADAVERMMRFIDIALEQAKARGDHLTKLLKRMDLARVSQDQGWRVIISCLSRLDGGYESHKRSALDCYRRYLKARLDLVEALNERAQKRLPRSARQNADANGRPDAERRRAALEERLSETSEVGVDRSRRKSPPKRSFRRIRKGEAVRVRLEPGRSLHFALAAHRFTLVPGDPVRVIDERGREAVVLPGKNIVGRGATADVAVDRRYRSVSRSHVILEVERDSVKFTDVSTHGTYLLEAHVEPRAEASDHERT
jgi:hypothetical protein